LYGARKLIWLDVSQLAARLSLVGQAANGKPIPGLPKPARYDVQGEITFIGQGVLPFRSRYGGQGSFPAGGQTAATETAELYLGARPLPNSEVYINPEIALGSAPGAGLGLGGYSNGDLVGQPILSSQFAMARSFVRWRIQLRQGKDEPVGTEPVGRAPNIIAGPVPQHRLVVTAGEFAISDVFDVNAYANNPRTHFMNYAFTNNLAYDFAQDPRGSDFGASVVLVNPAYSVRFGTFATPLTPGGQAMRYSLQDNHSEQLELDVNPQVLRTPKPPMTVRLLAYRNVGAMGRYGDAISSTSPGTPPDLSQVRHSRQTRAGYSFNLEQGLGDGGNTGFFARLGWADGDVESQSFAEVDQSFSTGVQISGARWRQNDDTAGIAFGINGISASHQHYLMEGGQGLTLGDGNLRYDPETIWEAYYMRQVSKRWQMSADVQWISNPGYNQDRGPAPVLSLRARYTF
jgi:hypothetical protein